MALSAQLGDNAVPKSTWKLTAFAQLYIG